MQKKVVYISGPITGVDNYWEAFERAEDDLSALGYIPLSPARLPGGMSNAQYMHICHAMIDSADAVLLLPGHEHSAGARLEFNYCLYVGKPYINYITNKTEEGAPYPREVTQAFLEADLKGAMGG